jgi:hypothetical protein
VTSALNDRVRRLEMATPATATSGICERSGLPHIRVPAPIDLVETIVRYCLSVREGGPRPAPPPRLCLCLDCCADGHDIARLTHGLPPERDAA